MIGLICKYKVTLPIAGRIITIIPRLALAICYCFPICFRRIGTITQCITMAITPLIIIVTAQLHTELLHILTAHQVAVVLSILQEVVAVV